MSTEFAPCPVSPTRVPETGGTLRGSITARSGGTEHATEVPEGYEKTDYGRGYLHVVDAS